MKKTLKILIPLLLAVLLAGGGAFYFLLVKPPMDAASQGEAALMEGRYEEAAAAFAQAQEGYGKLPFFAEKGEEAGNKAALALEKQARKEAEEAARLEAEAEEKRLSDAYAAAEALENAGAFVDAAEAFEALGAYADAESRGALCREQEADFWKKTVAEKTDTLSAGAWHTAAVGDVSVFYGDVRFTGAVPEAAEKVFSGYSGAFFLQDGKITPYGETFGEAESMAAFTDIRDAAAGFRHGLFLHEDGTVTALGSEDAGKEAAKGWTDIRDVAAGAFHSVGLRADGTVAAAGDNTFGQCDTNAWENAVAVDAGLHHTVALLADGTVIAAGDNQYGQCQVEDWQDILAISAGANFTLGLKADYTLVFAGDNRSGQGDVEGWTDVIAIAGGVYHTAALRMDGTLLFAGSNENGQRPVETEPVFASLRSVEPMESGAVGTACEYIYDTEEMLGPWLYVSPQGAVIIAVDMVHEKKPMRADLYSAMGSLPRGYVTKPEAEGRIIKMPPEGPETMARRHRCVFGMVGDFIGFTSNRKGVLMRGGIVYYDRNETSSMAVHPNGTLPCFAREEEITAEALIAEGVQDVFSFGPILVQDGEIGTDKKLQLTTATMRAAIGYACPYHYVAAITGRDSKVYSTFMDMAQIMKGYGCQEAYNLDGGHSTSMVFMGKEISLFTFEGKRHHNLRAMSDILGFLTSEKTRTTDEPLTVKPKTE